MRFLLLALIIAAAPASAEITSSTDAPVRGQAIQLTFAEPINSFTVTYRPGAVTAHDEVVSVPNARTVSWTPQRAGVVKIAAGDDTKNLSVRFTGAPATGILVMLVAGIILFGGAGLSLRMLLSNGKELPPPHFDS